MPAYSMLWKGLLSLVSPYSLFRGHILGPLAPDKPMPTPFMFAHSTGSVLSNRDPEHPPVGPS